jgi:signal-transduction protein with cAMP-binding, CBS, and nucleotidyltransferase domain
MQKLTHNHFTRIGTDQFIEDTNALMRKVKDIAITEDIKMKSSSTVMDALFVMTKSKLGAVAILNEDDTFHRLFTDGDLRRLLHNQTDDIQEITFDSMEHKTPITIDPEATLFEARKVFHEHNVDTLVVMNDNQVLGLIDIQHTI